jgi:hypothetical protein
MSEESKAEYRKKGNARGCISSGILTITPASLKGKVSMESFLTCKQNVHGKGVLESEDEGKNDRHLIIQAKERSSACALLGEIGNIGLEEEGIVVVSEEAFFRRESCQDATWYL